VTSVSFCHLILWSRLYGDHLIPVIKVFGFNPPDDVDQPYTYYGV